MSGDETAPEMLERLGTDAMLWAQEFSKTAVKLGYSEMDEGWLIGWFANAIENCDVVRCNPIRADLAAVTKERDRMREALMPFDGFPLHKWDGIGDDHALYGPFTLGHVRKYLSASCQGLIDNSNYLEKPDSCARAAIEGVTKKEGAGNE